MTSSDLPATPHFTYSPSRRAPMRRVTRSKGPFMDAPDGKHLAQILSAHQDEVLNAWLGQHLATAARRGLTPENEIREQFRNFLATFIDALARATSFDPDRADWDAL